jgi:hypothetical protein
MKTVNVVVVLQMDIKGDDNLQEVQDTLDDINRVLGAKHYQAQIFVSDISNSDISEIEQDEEE